MQPDPSIPPFPDILTTGGDERIALDPATGRNRYWCSPLPRGGLSFSSSTASAPSVEAFADAEAAYAELTAALRGRAVAEVHRDCMDALRGRLRRALHLDDDIDIAFAPSGTDTELLALLPGLASGTGRLTSLLASADEIGRSVPLAAGGRYFAASTPVGGPVVTGRPIAGFDDVDIEVRHLPLRASDGTPLTATAVTAGFERAAAVALAEGRRPSIHLVHTGKSGAAAATPALVAEIRAALGEAVDIVVDACQFRLSPETCRALLAAGCMVQVTGSKFLAGVPLSGAPLLPPAVGARIAGLAEAPAGLARFTGGGDFPANWRFGDADPGAPVGFAPWLRWRTALFELDRLLAVPQAHVAAIVDAFRAAVLATVGERAGFGLMETDLPGPAPASPLDRRTIFCFGVRDAAAGFHGEARLRAIYDGLARDLAPTLGPAAGMADRAVAAHVCRVGQPVVLARDRNGGPALAALRLSLDAPTISAFAESEPADTGRAFAREIAAVLDKIALIERRAAAA